MTDKKEYLVAALLQELKCPLGDLATQLIKMGAFPQVVTLDLAQMRTLILSTAGPTGPLWAPVGGIPGQQVDPGPLRGMESLRVAATGVAQGPPVGPRDPSMPAETPKHGVPGPLTAAKAAEAVNLYPKLFTACIKKGLVKPLKVSRGPKGMARYHFDHNEIERIKARQAELRRMGVISSRELQEATGVDQAFVSTALKDFPRVKDGCLLQTKDSKDAGAHRVYYKNGALQHLGEKIELARQVLKVDGSA